MALSKSDSTKVAIGVAVLMAAVALGIYNWRSGSPQLAEKINFVCAQTGKTFTISREQASRMLPLENPETHQRTLLPCYDEGGTLHVARRYRDVVKSLGEKNKVIDLSTLQVKMPPT